MSLEDLIKRAKGKYYQNGTSDLTDEEYDAIEDEIRTIDPNHPVLKTVGAKPEGPWLKIKHEIPMGSLNKVQNEEQWHKWLERYLLHNTSLLMIEKLDGISIAIRYENGHFKQALTRGDGNVGENITPNVSKMKNVPNRLVTDFTGWLRGEILLFKNDWENFPSDSKSLRNIAAGTSKRLDGEGCEHLTVLFYEVHFDIDDIFSSKHEELGFIKHDLGFMIPNMVGPVKADEVPDHIEWWSKHRDEINYEIDGVVVEINDRAKFYSLGEKDMRPKGAVAYKFPPEHKTTTVEAITWQVGRTGRITPVAELLPVDIGGVTIKRTSLHTARMAHDTQAGPGARVVISRRNDVIPYIEKVIPGTEVSIAYLKECPECKGNVAWEGEYIICINLDCTTKLPNAIKVWTDKLGVLHWGDSFIQGLVDKGLIKKLPDIYQLNWDKVADHFGSGIAKRAKESLWSKREMEFATFISGLNIRMCSTSTPKKMVEAGINNYESLINVSLAKLLEVESIGNIKAQTILDGIESSVDTINELSLYVNIKQRTGGMVGMSFCFTGKMSKPRKELEAMAEEAGAEIKKTVTQGLTYLVMADPSSGSSKAKKAEKYGTKCISEQDFMRMI
jgi:DNA ligase (NAD+)